ncbi:MAG: CHAT domain-containing protein [Saprospiraceae bacterium]|nr:CHAT domain-containing protein [Saprospiraceae bacterium]
MFHLPTSSVFMGPRMTTDHFLDNSKNTWVHISSHSYTSDTIRRANNMVFRSEAGYDYFQNADVLKMKAVPGFVFLNSCEGGQGVAQESEIQNSLAIAFHEIGCPSTLSNLWPIKDKNALLFSLDFYSFIMDGCDVGESFRLSKLKNINTTENECFGYVLTGNPKVILNLDHH